MNATGSMSPQQARIYSELQKGSLNTGDFMARECPHCGKGKGLNIVNFSQRITELNRLLAPYGERIESKPIKSNLWEYWLVKIGVDRANGSDQTTENVHDVEGRQTEVPIFGMNFCTKHRKNYAFGSSCMECIKEKGGKHGSRS